MSPVPIEVADLLIFLWLGLETWSRYLGRRGRLRARGGTSHDRGSFWGILVSIWICLLTSFYFFLRGVGGFLPPASLVVGAAVVLAGIGVRTWAVMTLGRFFSPFIRIEEEHRLIRNGPYRWVRHPSYTGALLIPLGLAITLGTISGTLLTGVVTFVAFGYRIQVEEAMLIQRFGEEYRRYAAETWRLIPGLY